MKSTGMAPRIDKMGRVVIPKSIRTRMGINDNDPLEIFLSDDGAICFKPYRENLLTNAEILDSYNEMNQEEKVKLIKKMVENL